MSLIIRALAIWLLLLLAAITNGFIRQIWILVLIVTTLTPPVVYRLDRRSKQGRAARVRPLLPLSWTRRSNRGGGFFASALPPCRALGRWHNDDRAFRAHENAMRGAAHKKIVERSMTV